MEYITLENPKHDCTWMCICGNTPDSYGFFSCDASGNPMEEGINNNWPGLYICDHCWRIIQQRDLAVIGRRKKPPKYD